MTKEVFTSKKKSVLVFLHNANDASFLNHELVQRGYKVTVSASSSDVFIKTSFIKYDIVIMSIDPKDAMSLSLPGIIKRKSPETGILLLASIDSAYSAEKFKSLGVVKVVNSLESILSSVLLDSVANSTGNGKANK